MSDVKEFVTLEASKLDLDTSIRRNCPFCYGVNTFSITLKEEGTILFNCYRASCGKKGRVNLPGVIGQFAIDEKAVPNRHKRSDEVRYKWEASTYEVPEKYPYDKISLETYIDHRTKLYRIPYSDQNQIITRLQNGFFVRTIGKKDPMNYLDGPNEGLLKKKTNVFVSRVHIVEDIVSAMWMYQCFPHVPVMCLFGTYVTKQMARKMTPYSVWVWCLDPDTNYGNQNYQKVRDLWPYVNHHFCLLLKDPKHLTIKELKKELGYVGEETTGGCC